MSRTRVLDLAKELGIETKVAIIKLQELGIQVKNHFNAISDLEASKLRALHRSGKTTEKTSIAKPANKLIIRRKIESTSEEVLLDTKEEPTVDSDTLEQTISTAHEHEELFSPPSLKDHAPPKEASVTRDETHLNEKKEPLEEDMPLSQDRASEAAVKKNLDQIKEPQNKIEFEKTVSLHKDTSTPNSQTQTKAISHPKASNSVPTAQTTPAPSRPSAFTGGAVIVRKADPASVTQNAAPQKRPGYSPSQQPPFQRGQNVREGQGGPGQRTNHYPQNNQGGYSQNAQGGYRRGNDNSASSQNNTFIPSKSHGQNSYTSSSVGGGQGPRGNYNQAGGAPRQGYAPQSKPFVMPDAAAPATNSKDLPSRLKYTDKDREKRRSVDETDYKSQKNATRLKTNKFEDDLSPLDYDLLEEHEDQGVRTMIPNRKKTSSFKRKEQKKVEIANPTKASKKILRIDEFITVNDLASELSQKASAIIKTLMKLGMMATINQQLDFDTASFVAQEFGYEAQNASVSIGDILNKKAAKTENQTLESRPPIVTIMGHVDHGKTSLLDAIRSTKVASKEAGGITQHIGAYQIDYKGRKLTFLDTPGHEAFTAMRGRGAKVTDIVILVVAADDGVMPQTIEAISHAKAAQVPIIVAVNKMDKAGINLDKITRELADQGVISEEWGGDALFVKVSAKTHLGLDELIETILLQSDVLDLKASKEGLAEGIVIEAKLDKARGPVATVIVTKGILKQQDSIVIGKSYGRVRAMFNDQGQKLSQAEPATPVEIVGLDGIPEAGDHFNCVATDAIAKEAVAFRIEKQRQKDLSTQRNSSMEELFAQMGHSTDEKPKELAIIIKADTHGSAEAIKNSIQKLDTSKVKTRIIHTAVGGITETDAILAQASNAIVVGFNVRPDKMAAQFAERSGVLIQCFSIIYQLTEAIQAAMLGTLAPIKQDKVLGHAEVRNTFSVPKVGVIAGTMVTDGKVTRNSHIRIVRDGVVIYTGRVGSLKRFKDDAKEVAQGFECGISVENYNDIKVGDVLEAFIIEEIAATL